MGTTLSSLVNREQEIPIGGKTLKVRKLSLEEIFIHFEQKIRSQKIREAQQIAAALTGTDKVSFLKDVWKELPSGEALMTIVNQSLGTVEGITDLLHKSINKCNPDFTREMVCDLITDTSLDELSPIIEFICGTKVIEGSKEETPAGSKK